MSYWLVKFAPFRCSWSKCLLHGKFEIYGVRNAQSRNNLKNMRCGDMVLFYHSQEELSIMGIMNVVSEAHQDFTTSDSSWVSVTFEPIHSFKIPVKLEVIKSTASLQNIGLIRQPRLAIMSLEEIEYNKILELGGI